MKKKLQVVMIPTEKASHLFIQKGGDYEGKLHWSDIINETILDCGDQHLYILSDEKIKEGDWVALLDSNGNGFLRPQQWLGKGTLTKDHKKIIAKQASSLCSCDAYDDEGNLMCMNCEPIPPIPESFIKAYIKACNEGNPITEVQVEYEKTPLPRHVKLEINSEYGAFPNVKKTKEELHDLYKQVHETRLKLKEDGSIIIHRAKTYSLNEIVRIAEYVRVGAKSTPDMKTLDLVNEYLGIEESL